MDPGRGVPAPEEHAEQIGVVFRALLESGYGILFHCRTGKDRTGLVAALILTALGVSHEDVIADFLLSNRGLSDPRTRDLKAIEGTSVGRYGERARFSLTGVPVEWLERLLGDLNLSYGSVAGYLEARGPGFGPTSPPGCGSSARPVPARPGRYRIDPERSSRPRSRQSPTVQGGRTRRFRAPCEGIGPTAVSRRPPAARDRGSSTRF